MTLTPLAAWLRGLGLLLGFAGLGEVVVRALHLPVPAPVLGMLLLWAALSAGVIKLTWLEQAAGDLLGVLGLLFVPATVGVVGYLSAGASWGLWLLVMLVGLLTGAGTAALLASKLMRP